MVQTHTNRVSLLTFLLKVAAKNLEKDGLSPSPSNYLLVGVKSIVWLTEKECINVCKSL